MTSVESEVVAGLANATKINGFADVKFGTSQRDLERGSLYVTTNGGATNYYTQSWEAGGMLVPYDTAGLGMY